MCSVAFAQTDIKPNIPLDKVLIESEQVRVKEYLGGKIFVEMVPTKNDYVDRYDRGTVKFNPRKGVNYLGDEVYEASNMSFHKVVIPDGTILNDINFTQKNPHTNAIQGKNLTFISCNLNNVEIDPTWILEDCLAIHTRNTIIVEEGKTYELQEVEKGGKFEEVFKFNITDQLNPN